VQNGPAKRQLSTQGLRQCKGSLFEGGVREPGLIEWPALFSTNVKSDAIVGTWDFLPTVLDLLHLPAHAPAPIEDWAIDGVSLVPLLRLLAAAEETDDETPPPLGRAASHVSVWKRPAPSFWFSSDQVSMLDWPWKYLYAPKAGQCTMAPPYDPEDLDVGPYLFNLQTDPGESLDLSQTEPAQLAKMAAAVDARVHSVLHSQQAESKCAVAHPLPVWPPGGGSPPSPPSPASGSFTLTLQQDRLGRCVSASSDASHAALQLGSCTSPGALWTTNKAANGAIESAEDPELGGMKCDHSQGVSDPCAAGTDLLVAQTTNKNHFVLEIQQEETGGLAAVTHASLRASGCDGMCAGVLTPAVPLPLLTLVNCSSTSATVFVVTGSPDGKHSGLI
jgi:hypothetical protein